MAATALMIVEVEATATLGVAATLLVAALVVATALLVVMEMVATTLGVAATLFAATLG